MPTLDIKPPAGAEPELNLLLPESTLEESLWKSLFRNLDDFFFPKKQPPLVLTSKPIPVKDIWGFYDYKKNGVLGSTVVHVLALAAIIGITLLGRRMVEQIVNRTRRSRWFRLMIFLRCRHPKRKRVEAVVEATA